MLYTLRLFTNEGLLFTLSPKGFIDNGYKKGFVLKYKPSVKYSSVKYTTFNSIYTPTKRY